METRSLKHASDFFDRARAFSADSPERMLSQQASFAVIRDAFLAYSDTQARDAETEAPKFNVFRVLRMERDEVRLHSALLAHWLNPRGSHGQGTLFLDTFCSEIIQEIDPSMAMLPTPVQFGKWRVSAEKFTIYGNLDIVLQSPEHEVLWVVENKIDAGEGDKQLSRYRKWLDSQARYRTKRLFFLTPDGRRAETLPDEHAYTRLSYQQHITRWIAATIPRIRSSKVRAIVEQHLDVIQHLEVEP